MKYVEIKIKSEHNQALEECSVITGRTVQSLINEALEQYIECDVSALVEEKAARTASA